MAKKVFYVLAILMLSASTINAQSDRISLGQGVYYKPSLVLVDSATNAITLQSKAIEVEMSASTPGCSFKEGMDVVCQGKTYKYWQATFQNMPPGKVKMVYRHLIALNNQEKLELPALAYSLQNNNGVPSLVQSGRVSLGQGVYYWPQLIQADSATNSVTLQSKAVEVEVSSSTSGCIFKEGMDAVCQGKTYKYWQATFQNMPPGKVKLIYRHLIVLNNQEKLELPALPYSIQNNNRALTLVQTGRVPLGQGAYYWPQLLSVDPTNSAITLQSKAIEAEMSTGTPGCIFKEGMDAVCQGKTYKYWQATFQNMPPGKVKLIYRHLIVLNNQEKLELPALPYSIQNNNGALTLSKKPQHGPFSRGDFFTIRNAQYEYVNGQEPSNQPSTMVLTLQAQATRQTVTVRLRALTGAPFSLNADGQPLDDVIIRPDMNANDSDVYSGAFQGKSLLYDGGDLYVDVTFVQGIQSPLRQVTSGSITPPVLSEVGNGQTQIAQIIAPLWYMRSRDYQPNS